jgi:iron complex outermembrane receptor protein
MARSTLKYTHPILASVTLLFTLPTVPVQALDYTAEADFFGESPIVLTVSRLHKPVSQSPASVSVIDREMIRNSGARELADLFRMVPGFIISDFLGHTPVVTYQGLGQIFHRQMQVLIDGRSVFIPSSGGVPWSSLPLMIEDIERIEVTRGPNAVTYGSNAFLATINIITRHAAEDVGGKVAVTQELASNSDTNDVYVRIGNQVDDLDWRLSAGRESDTGYDSRFDGKSQQKLNIRTDFLTSHNQFWSVATGINESTQELGSGAANNIFRDSKYTNSYQNIRWELVEQDVQTTIKLAHTRNEFEDEFFARNYDLEPGVPPVKGLVSFSRWSDRSDLEAYQNRRLSSDLSINYGLGVRREEVRSFYLFHDRETRSRKTYNLFSNAEWKPFTDTTLDIGFLSENPDGADREESYRFSAIQTLNNHHVRLVSSTAKRHPILWEKEGQIAFDLLFEQPAPPPYNALPPEQSYLLVTWLNNAQVEPESIRSNEIGVLSEFLDRRLITDVKLFRYRISDQLGDFDQVVPIVVVPGVAEFPVTARTVINENKTTVKGLELSFNYSPQHNRYRLYGALSRVDANSTDKDLSDSFPDLTGYLGGHVNFLNDHQISSTVYYVDTMSTIDRGDQVPDYTRLDMRYQYTIDHKKDVNIELIGYNLLEKYADYRNKDEHKPSYLLKLSGRF